MSWGPAHNKARVSRADLNLRPYCSTYHCSCLIPLSLCILFSNSMDSDTIQDIDSTIFDLLRTAIEEVVNHYSVNADDLDGSRNLIDLVQELLELYGFIIGVEGQENDVYVAVRDLVTALITDVEHRCMKRRREGQKYQLKRISYVF